MDSIVSGRPVTAKINASLAVLLGMSVVAAHFYASSLASDAVARHGSNVDSGAYLTLFAYLVLAPAAALFGFAAVAAHRQWHDRRAVQWLAVVWLAVPAVLLLASFLFG